MSSHLSFLRAGKLCVLSFFLSDQALNNILYIYKFKTLSAPFKWQLGSYSVVHLFGLSLFLYVSLCLSLSLSSFSVVVVVVVVSLSSQPCC